MSGGSAGTSSVVLPPRETDDSRSLLLILLRSSPRWRDFRLAFAVSGALAPAAVGFQPRLHRRVLYPQAPAATSPADGFFVPQLLQNASPGTVVVPHLRHSAIYSQTHSTRYYANQRSTDLLNNVETEKGLSHDNLVAVAQRLTSSLRQSFSTIDKRAVGRSQIFQDVCPSLNVSRAWRRETFASGSSESKSTSGKIPRPHPSVRYTTRQN